VDYWVDLEIPWAEFGQVFEEDVKGEPHAYRGSPHSRKG
jgi:hypothetical protein